MKIGLALKLDVTKLDKSRFFIGKNGKYADLTVFIDTENVSDYGDNGIISQSASQAERKSGTKMPIIGNAKIFYRDDEKRQNSEYKGVQKNGNESDNVPF